MPDITTKFSSLEILGTLGISNGSAMKQGIPKQDISRRFSRAAGSYRDVTPVQERSAQLLFARINELGLLQKNTPENGKKPVLLDVGMGVGRLFALLGHNAQNAWELHGIDFAPGMLAEARRAWPQAQLICQDAESYEYRPESYDLILSNFAMQWFAEPLHFTEKMYAALRAGGSFACALPLAGSLEELQEFVRHSSGEELPLYPLPRLEDFLKLEKTWGETNGQLKGKAKRRTWLWQQEFKAEYKNAFAALQAIKKAGAHTSGKAEAETEAGAEVAPLSYAALSKLQQRQGQGLGNFSLTYRVLFFIGQKL